MKTNMKLIGSAFAAAALLAFASADTARADAAEDWTGWTLGGYLGHGSGESKYESRPGIDEEGDESSIPLHMENSVDGWVFGLQGGYDMQYSPKIIFGFLGDIAFTTIDGSPGQEGPPAHFETEVDFLMTLRGKAGYVVTPDFVTYVHGGLALGNISHRSLNTPGSGSGPPGPWKDLNQDTFQAGWVFGLGMEGRLTQNWSLFAEYAAIGFQDIGIGFQSPDDEDDGDCEEQSPEFNMVNDLFLHNVTVGLKYRF
jgi:outer membrane immunogenic protein